jgi:hypothetical protein
MKIAMRLYNEFDAAIRTWAEIPCIHTLAAFIHSAQLRVGEGVA